MNPKYPKLQKTHTFWDMTPYSLADTDVEDVLPANRGSRFL